MALKDSSWLLGRSGGRNLWALGNRLPVGIPAAGRMAVLYFGRFEAFYWLRSLRRKASYGRESGRGGVVIRKILLTTSRISGWSLKPRWLGVWAWFPGPVSEVFGSR
ncbi:hypothetical protein Nepgr_032549 [Nepenthes gracilis]|uniref:Uncharacterized protein n=1 Tax=Nepenthes gracilis TaxID=150966 RepID=A0AAD3Y8D7_NEPGR|nr:hypothetical protein Nepgr_032549 [Nepenthes gracilis]